MFLRTHLIPCPRGSRWLAAGVLVIFIGTAWLACSPARPAPQPVAVTRELGTWEGTGSSTIGIINESGRFRVKWATKEGPSPGGTFRLTVHSAVSGRPLQVIVDHRGAGGATVDFADDPRPYNLMVDSAGVEWSIAVEEIVAGRAP